MARGGSQSAGIAGIAAIPSANQVQKKQASADRLAATSRRRLPRPIILGGILGLAFTAMAPDAQAQQLVAEPVGTFTRPVYVAVAPGKKNLLFVVEQAGVIQVLVKDAPRTKPFLDIRDMVLGQPDPDAHNEQGLLSMAFAPNYKDSGLFYVAFNNMRGNVEVAEFQRSARNAKRADPASYRKLLAVRHRDAGNHNGGQLQFGRDGYLYVSAGDGGGGGDPGDNARNLDKLLGKILRIDPNAGKSRPYKIPKSNPFRKTAGRNEIFAYGLRNPWRFSFDRKRMLIADVGQSTQEEINLLATERAAGANFGWPQYEGNAIFDDDRPGADPVTFPQLVYGHDNGECSVTGGYVVRGSDLPDFAKRYIYADYCIGEIRSFIANKKASDDTSTSLTLPFLTSFGKGHGGRIYAMQSNGVVSRLRQAPTDIKPDSRD